MFRARFLVGWSLLFLFVMATVSAAAETVVIGFERREGFPKPGRKFNGRGVPRAIVARWTVRGTRDAACFTDDGPGGAAYPDAPKPVSGRQIGGMRPGIGNNIVTMALRRRAKLELVSFYWAWRGNGDTRAGGDAVFEAEYFDLNGKSVGKDRFYGGLNKDWSPKFEPAQPSVRGIALSKVVFRGLPPDPAKEHGTFFLDDITLSRVTGEAVALGGARPGASGGEEIVVSFEPKEGFPGPGERFNGLGIPRKIVGAWGTDKPGSGKWFIDDGPGGVEYPDAPKPISGRRVAGLQRDKGINVGIMDLNDEAGLGLVSFYWAWRGNGNTRPGGNAWLEAEYFDLNGKSVGKDKFFGGLNPDWTPKFELAKPSVQGGALSKVVFRGTPPNPAEGQGTFFLDEVRLAVRPDPMAPFKPVQPAGMTAFKKMDTTPPVVNLLSPAPDSTVSADAEISAKFTETGSGVDLSAVKIMVDGVDLTGQAKVTQSGITLRPVKPLGKGIHRVVLKVADKAGNAGNRAVWRFGVGERVPVRAVFENGVFKVSEEPYFPIGIYNASCNPYNKETLEKPYLAQVCAAGVNCQLMGESMGPKELAVMLKLGMKAMKSVFYALGNITAEDTSLLQRHARDLRDHPGMLAWWASDPDTIEATRRNMALGYRTLKETDPNHPVIWILSHADRYKESLAFADAAFVYFYPIMQHNMTPVSTLTYTLKPAFAAANPLKKQVWFATQEIDLRICDGRRLASPDEFRPTPAEMRVMNYLVLTQGVKGLFFYAAGGSPTPGVYNDLTEYPAQWNELLRIAREVRHISPALAAGKAVKTAQTNNSAIYYRELELDGTHTLISLNVATTPVVATWRFTRAVRPAVLFEDRVAAEESVEMTDAYKPMEVHIYQWK